MSHPPESPGFIDGLIAIIWWLVGAGILVLLALASLLMWVTFIKWAAAL